MIPGLRFEFTFTSEVQNYVFSSCLVDPALIWLSSSPGYVLVLFLIAPEKTDLVINSFPNLPKMRLLTRGFSFDFVAYLPNRILPNDSSILFRFYFRPSQHLALVISSYFL